MTPNPSTTPTLTASLVDATRSARVWREFLSGQRRCYARYGVADAAKAPQPRPNVIYCVAIRSNDGTLVAGARLQVRTKTTKLPLEVALHHESLAHELDRRDTEGIAEVGALWSGPSLQGTGIGGAVIAAATAFAAAIGVRHLVSLAHQHNRFTRRVGFEPDASIGALPYPDARYRSTVNWCDAADVPTAERAVRFAVMEMRRHALANEPVRLPRFTAPRAATVRDQPSAQESS